MLEELQLDDMKGKVLEKLGELFQSAAQESGNINSGTETIRLRAEQIRKLLTDAIETANTGSVEELLNDVFPHGANDTLLYDPKTVLDRLLAKLQRVDGHGNWKEDERSVDDREIKDAAGLLNSLDIQIQGTSLVCGSSSSMIVDLEAPRKGASFRKQP